MESSTNEIEVVEVEDEEEEKTQVDGMLSDMYDTNMSKSEKSTQGAAAAYGTQL